VHLYVSYGLQEQKKGRQFTYNVTLRGVRAVIVTVEEQWVLHNLSMYEGWNFNSGNYLFTTDTK